MTEKKLELNCATHSILDKICASIIDIDVLLAEYHSATYDKNTDSFKDLKVSEITLEDIKIFYDKIQKLKEECTSLVKDAQIEERNF